MKALVLAGGKGTRLRPLTYTTAKQLIPVGNKPILCYVINHILKAGIENIGIIVSPDTGEQIKDAVDIHFPTVDISYICQDNPLGLAHAVKVAQQYISEDPFIMYLGDNLIGQGIENFVKSFKNSNADAIVLLKRVKDPSMFGVAEVDSKNQIIKLIEKPQNPVSDLALVGVYAFSPAIYQSIDQIKPSQRGELEITDAIQNLLENGHLVESIVLENWWLDTGKKDDLLEANRVVLDDWTHHIMKGTIDETSKIVGRVSVENGAVIQNSILRGPLSIGCRAIIEDSIIGPYSSIGENCLIKKSKLEHCVLMDNVHIENVETLKDSVVGRGAKIHCVNNDIQTFKFMIGDDAEVFL